MTIWQACISGCRWIPGLVLLLGATVSPLGAQVGGVDEPVLVVPFENSGREGRLHWLTEAAAVLVSRDLESLGAHPISRDERLLAFERLQLPQAAVLSEATVIKVAQLIGAAQVVRGSFSVADGRLSVKARIIRLDAGRMPPEAVEEGRLEDLFAIFDRLARKLAPPGTVAVAAAPDAPGPLLAFEAYTKGLVAESPAARIRFLEAALAVDQGYDAARIALWQVHTEGGDHRGATAAAEAVSASSPFSPKARFLAALSRISLEQYDDAYRRLKALADEAPSPAVHNNLGVVQSRRGSTPQSGRPTYYFTKAVEAAPEDPDYHFNLGYAYWLERNAEATIYWLKETVRRNPADGEAHVVLAAALQSVGATAESAREMELARQLSSTYGEWERRAGATADPVPKGLERVRTESDVRRSTLFPHAALPGEQKAQRELADFHLDRGRRLVDEQQDRAALEEFRRSLFLSPYQADAHLLVGRIHFRAGRLREAADSLRISLWCQKTAAGHVALGEVLLVQNDLLGAQTEANRALVLDIGNREARALLERAGAKREYN